MRNTGILVGIGAMLEGGVTKTDVRKGIGKEQEGEGN